MAEQKMGEQGAESQRMETSAGEIGSDAAEAKAQVDRLLFANSCRSYFMFSLADDPD